MARGRSGQSGAIHARGRRHIFPMLAVAAVLASFAAAALGFLPVFAQEEGAVSGLTLTSDSSRHARHVMGRTLIRLPPITG